MSLFTKDTIDRVREAVDMVELVSQKTDLRRSGTRWSGLCPFHDERTPSFSVNPEEKLYYCFGCGEGGDVFKFVQQTEALEFQEAVELLADRYNVRVEREESDPQADQRRRRRDRLHTLLDRAASFYAKYLAEAGEASAAREYLASRGLSDKVLEEFRVGYSPSAWDRMLVGAREGGFSEEELVAAGLAQRGRGGNLYDRFRGRVMFPLADARGRVLGFGARQMGEGRGPKYLNTSENDLYHKGRQLFGIDVARKEAMKSGRFVVVEGYTDVLALHQAGIREAVAIMGTAMTQEQLAELAKVGDSNRRGSVFLALDADRAGREAMLRAARLAEDRGVDLRVVDMPEGTDPADLVSAEGCRCVHTEDGPRRPHDRVSGTAGTCRCRPGHAVRQGPSIKGGAGVDLSRARTNRNERRARPRWPRTAWTFPWTSCSPRRPARRSPRARDPRPQCPSGSSHFAQNASFLPSASPPAPSAVTILRVLPMTHFSSDLVPPRTAASCRALR